MELENESSHSYHSELVIIKVKIQYYRRDLEVPPSYD